MNIESDEHHHRMLRIQKRLNRTSESYCLAKWLRSTIYMHLGTTHSCCIPEPHKIPLEELRQNSKALHVTAQKLESQKMMIKGLKPKECSYCWKNEDQQQISERTLKSAFFTDIEEERQIVQKTLAGEKVNPAYLEIAFDSTCNFKCLYCSPQYSTTWAKELKEFGPYNIKDYKDDLEISAAKRILPSEDNPYVTAFWDWWPTLVKDLKVFRITGGEPLLSPQVWKLLKWFEAHENKNLILALNSNMGVPTEKVDQFLEQLNNIRGNIKSFTLFASMESTDAQAEYSRYGLNYSLFKSNINKIINDCQLPLRLSFMSTVNVFSLPKLANWLEYVSSLRQKNPKLDITIDFTHLQNPKSLTTGILPKVFVEYLDSAIEVMAKNCGKSGFSIIEINKLKRIRQEFLNTETNETTLELRKRFLQIVKEADRRRKTDFKQCFPEYSSFLDSISQEL